jgi:uncharacterized membrane protein YkgB
MRTSTYELPLTTKVIGRFNHLGVSTFCRMNMPFARLALFVVYFWFGLLKMVGVSPAGPLVSALWMKTIPFIPLPTFMVLFSAYEMLIGVLFLIPKLERPAIGLLLMHISMTVMPLVLLRGIVWQNFMVPSLEGQYIIKNIVIVALARSIGANLRTARRDRRKASVRPDFRRLTSDFANCPATQA